MITSLAENDARSLELTTAFSSLLGQPVHQIERIGGGRNSQVYRLNGPEVNHHQTNASGYVAKLYFQHQSDQRNRLQTEFTALSFLWENGLRCIPQPIVADPGQGFAIYEYIEGHKLTPPKISRTEIEQAVQFLVRLKSLKDQPGSPALSQASEACFSIQAIVSNVEQRFERLRDLDLDGESYQALRMFLTQEFLPAFEEVVAWVQLNLQRVQVSFIALLPTSEKTLSPSDFGFHNALQRSDGQIVFLDFEYFGWDDPAKMITDFLLHPAVPPEESLKQHFTSAILSGFAEYENLAKRVELVYPLFGLKWCLILLNEFVPADLLRRGFASANSLDRSELQLKQLAKAKHMLDRIRNSYEHFPYYC
jgi:thiamine kinase-like enzyme